MRRGATLIERWLIPTFVVLTFCLVAVWIVSTLLYVGRARLTKGSVLLIAGIAGDGLLVVFGVAVLGLLISSLIDEQRVRVLAEIAAVVRRLEAAGHLSSRLVDDSSAAREARRLEAKAAMLRHAQQRKARYDARDEGSDRQQGEQQHEPGNEEGR